MNLIFHKYHGSGNDFIIIDNRHLTFDPAPEDKQAMIAAMCKRHTGIGADGLMLLEDHPESDFRMRYFNADGKEGSLCGNGSRCIAAFASQQGIVRSHELEFMASDGKHKAEILDQQHSLFRVKISLHDASRPAPISPSTYFVDTGSPHLVIFVKNADDMDVFTEGKKIRYSGGWAEKGVNVNFTQLDERGGLLVRTYERGVENETLSCGTGVTAAAIAAWEEFPELRRETYKVFTKGGDLQVGFLPPGKKDDTFGHLHLSGPAQFVYEGKIEF